MRPKTRSVVLTAGIGAVAAALILVGLSVFAALNSLSTYQVKSDEMGALLALMPDDRFATHIAVSDGDWFDTSTWDSGTVPGTGSIVRVPVTRTVLYDGAADTHLFMVRVDGTLRIHADDGAETRMVVDTLFATHGSTLAVESDDVGSGSIEIQLRPFDIESGRLDDDIAWSEAARAYYRDGSPVVDTGAGTRSRGDSPTIHDGAGVLGRFTWDPKQLSLGIVAHGSTRIYGQEKSARLSLAETPLRGHDQLNLDGPPSGWSVGDTIIVTGTHYVGRDPITGGYLGTEDEIRSIIEIDGNVVSLDAPLEFDHDTPREDLSTYVANVSRSILIRSHAGRDLDDLDADGIGGVSSELGHVMFMHSADVIVQYAAFDDLGRTNKNDVADDFRKKQFDGLQYSRLHYEESLVEKVLRHLIGVEPRLWLGMPADEITNPRGRYALHLHRAGAQAENRTARIEGCVVTGGPGWGFVSHDSRADFIDNVTYGVLGAGFVAETGNETGVWEGNTAINTYGADFNSPLLEPRGDFRGEYGDVMFENGDFEGTVLLEKRGAWMNHDFSHFGNGFWFQGKLIDAIDNVSVNSGHWGYFFMFRAPEQIYVDRAVLQEPLVAHSPAGIHPVAPGLNVFTGNESIADRGGLVMIGIDSGRNNDETSLVADFTAWEVGQTGTRAQYYPGYTIRDSVFIASTSPAANPDRGVFLDKMQMITVLAHLEIEGFQRQYDLRKMWSPGTEMQGFRDPYELNAAALEQGSPVPFPLGYAHVIVDPGFSRSEAAADRNMGETYRAEDVLIDSSELDVGRLRIALNDDSLRINRDLADIEYGVVNDPVRPTLQEGHVLMLDGIKTDSIGEIPIRYHNSVLVWHADGVDERLQTEGYYRMPNGSNAVILEEVFSDRYTADKLIYRFAAELDLRWDLGDAVDRGEFIPAEHPSVYVPAFLLEASEAQNLALGRDGG